MRNGEPQTSGVAVSKAALIGHELSSLRKELGVLSLVVSKRDRAPLDDIEIRGAALSLASLYNGMERVLKQYLLDRNLTLGKAPIGTPNCFRGRAPLGRSQ